MTVALEADLCHTTAPLAQRLRWAIIQNAHLFEPIAPESGLGVTFLSRLLRYSSLVDYATRSISVAAGFRERRPW